jgi:hypothetical protein
MVWVHDGERFRAWALVGPKEHWFQSKQWNWWREVRVWLPRDRDESTREDQRKYKPYGRVIGPWLTKSEDHAIARLPALKTADEIWADRLVRQRLVTEVIWRLVVRRQSACGV